MDKKIFISMVGSNETIHDLFQYIINSEIAGSLPPDEFSMDYRKIKWTDKSLEECFYKSESDLHYTWNIKIDKDSYDNLVIYSPDETDPSVKFAIYNNIELYTPKKILSIIEEASFTHGSAACLFKSWGVPDPEDPEDDYSGPSFGVGNYKLGWACFFKGEEGHKRLVSRRWLDYGPWRVIRGKNDTTLVQFHDQNVDMKTAFEQAYPGHQRMGISETGGYLKGKDWFQYFYKPEGTYDIENRKFEIMIGEREIEQGEMLEVCAIRLWQPFGEKKIVDSVAYVFIYPEMAQRYLHELWLREIECWTFKENGERIRLDLDYQPPVPVKPDWVAELEK